MRASAAVTVLTTNYRSESRAIFAAMTVRPSSARRYRIDQTVRALVSAGIWQQLDVLYFLAAADSQSALLNWKNPGTLTAVTGGTAPAFVADRGFTGNGSDGRLQTGYTPSTAGLGMAQNSASIWVWCLTGGQSNGEIGALGAAGNTFLRARNASDQVALRVNDNTGNVVASVTDGTGLTGASRAASGTKKAWKNGVQLGSDFSVASTALASGEQWICAVNNGAEFSTKQIAMAAWGQALTGLELAFYNAGVGYMQGVGAA